MDKKLLKKAIKKAGNQSKLALQLGCSRNFISLIMLGKKPLPSARYNQISNYIEGRL